MASYLRSNLSPVSISPVSLSPPTNTNTSPTSFIPVRCGPRNNRGPLLKGRTLSTEAILAVQSLKRAHRSNNLNHLLPNTLNRLIKSDLIAAFNELIRQDHCDLALLVLSAVRSEYQPDLTVYADLVSALARKKMWHDIDRLIRDLEGEGVVRCDDRGLVRLVKALIAAERVDSTVRIYGMMKRSGWGSDRTAEDEYLGKVLEKGFRKFGEDRLAQEVDVEFGKLFKAILDKTRT